MKSLAGRHQVHIRGGTRQKHARFFERFADCCDEQTQSDLRVGLTEALRDLFG